MQFSLKSALLFLTWAATFCGAFATGSIFWLSAAVAGLVVLLTYVPYRVARNQPRFIPFFGVFSLCGWAGFVFTAHVPLPMSDVPTWQVIYWEMDDNWFNYTLIVQIAIAHLWQTLVIAFIAGIVAQILYWLIRKMLGANSSEP